MLEDAGTQRAHLAGTSTGTRSSPQIAAVSFSCVIGFTTTGLGLALLMAPSTMINVFLLCSNEEVIENSMLELRLARLTGGSFIALSVSSLSLLLPSFPPKISSSVDKCRSSLFSQSIIGVTMIVVGLLDEQTDSSGSCGEFKAAWILGLGALWLVLACGGLMISFWPTEKESDEPPTHSERRLCFPRQQETTRLDEEITVPLLLSDQGINDEECNYELLEDEPEPEAAEVETSDGDHATTSRLTGTRRLIKLAAPQMFYLYIGCAVLLVRLPFSLSIPHFVSTTLGAVGRGDFAGARVEILLLFILGTIDAALDFWCVFLFGFAKERIIKGVRIDTFRSILKQDISFFDIHTSGELSSRLNSDCGEMAGDLTWFFRFSIEAVVRITGIAMYMLIRSPMLGGIALVIVPIVGVVNKLYGDWLRENAIEVQNALAKANSVAQETFSCVRTVIAFASERFEQEKYTNEIDVQYRLNVRQLYLTGIYYMAISTFLINTCVQAALLLIGAHLIQHDKLNTEVLLAFMLYQGQLQNETLNLFQSYSSLVKSSGAGDKVFALLDRTPPPPGTGSPDVVLGDNAEIDDSTDSNRSQSNVELCNLHFSYKSRPSHKVLEELSLNIPAGSTVALVGPSGCGKSTVMSLLQRFYDPSAGKILIDGRDLRTMDIQNHRRQIGTVTQDPVLFSGTILSNITYGNLSATRENAIEAAKLANAHNFIASFPDGYDTEVGERGAKLSGGQKQRVAIARAILPNPSLLLLDEATSALDAESEQVVQDSLDHLLKENKEMTTVIIAHRLRTVRHADCIAFIENGKVIEQGTHEELLQKDGGHYRNMVGRSGANGLLPDN